MSIDRVNSRGGSGPEPNRLQRTANAKQSGEEAGKRADALGAEPGDRVQLSETVRALASQDVPVGQVSPAKLQVVTERLVSDFYDEAEVRQVIAERLLEDLGITFKE